MSEVKQKKKFEVPHTIIIMLFIIFVCAILTYFIPAGEYDMQEVGGRMVAVPGSYHRIASTPTTLMQLLTVIPRGMVDSASIVFFIFIVGGAIGVLQDTGALTGGLKRLTKMLKGNEIFAIPVIMLIFGLGGAVIGTAEETVAFIPIMISLALALGYDSLTGVAMVLCGAGAGFAAAFMNPFTIGVAQGIAGLPIYSALPFRIVMFLAFEALTIFMVMRYASKVKKNPQSSLVYEDDLKREESMESADTDKFGMREKLILIVFVITLVILVYGVIQYGWYINEISGLFFGMSIVIAIIAKMGFNGYAKSLSNGMAALAGGALIVGFAKGILVVLTDANIIHTILYAASNVLNTLPSSITATGMYIFQCLLNVLVPSGSGQAAVTMPIMAPLADMVGVSRQTATIAFQLGDGISNILTPTSGYFMAALAMAGISWDKWSKWFLPLVALQYLLGLVFVIAAQMIGLGPF